jgi:hypothetical protein
MSIDNGNKRWGTNLPCPRRCTTPTPGLVWKTCTFSWPPQNMLRASTRNWVPIMPRYRVHEQLLILKIRQMHPPMFAWIVGMWCGCVDGTHGRGQVVAQFLASRRVEGCTNQSTRRLFCQKLRYNLPAPMCPINTTASHPDNPRKHWRMHLPNF